MDVAVFELNRESTFIVDVTIVALLVVDREHAFGEEGIVAYKVFAVDIDYALILEYNTTQTEVIAVAGEQERLAVDHGGDGVECHGYDLLAACIDYCRARTFLDDKQVVTKTGDAVVLGQY